MKLYALQTIHHSVVKDDKVVDRKTFNVGEEFDLPAADAKALVESGAASRVPGGRGAAGEVSQLDENGEPMKGGVKPVQGRDPRVKEKSNAAGDVKKVNPDGSEIDEDDDKGLDPPAGGENNS